MQSSGKYRNLTMEQVFNSALKHNGNLNKVAKELGIKNRSTIHNWLQSHNLLKKLRSMTGDNGTPQARGAEKNKIAIDSIGEYTDITYYGEQITTPEELLSKSGIDTKLYEVESISVNNWESAGAKVSGGGIWKTGLRQIKIRLRKKKNEVITLERLLKRMESKAPLFKKIKYPKPKNQKFKRALEVSIMDPHYGMQSYKGESDHNWSLEECEKLCMWAIDSLLKRAEPYGAFDEIIFPFGNDFLHHDNLLHTTTRGTPQPEGISYTHVFERAIKLATAMVDKLAEIAPVKIIQVSGNHDQVSACVLGHVLKSYYRNNSNISVDVSGSPYKFYRFGTNLIGYDHGHHIKPIRFAALMAHEAREHWAQTTYREWHCGDQHRKGSGKPVSFEEQGVSIEYLPALTPPNAWHRQKGFNWQQRGAMAFVWDYSEGPIARLQVNLNSYTGRPTGQ